MGKLAVIAIGGNSLIKDKQHMQVNDQYDAICETVKYITDIIEEGYEVVITHGNGPQVGFIMRRSEIAEEVEHMHPVPLVSCDADTQGALGYQIQQALHNEFAKRGIKKNAVTIVTQVEVDRNDQAFTNPAKPIGSFYDDKQVKRLRKEHPDWAMNMDAGRGYRRVVPSPMPKNIMEIDAIKNLVNSGFTVIAVGGGGIPVVFDESNILKGVNAVIDKDHASGMLATKLGADVFIISTAVENVCINFGKPNEKALGITNINRINELRDQNHFAPGSMLPKIEAALTYLKNGGEKAIITSPENILKAVQGKAGTVITN
ncbi:MAG: carbamate kinase [Clostridiales bacterium]|nr:carbamate kinase [Clostridiales bacterium]